MSREPSPTVRATPFLAPFTARGTRAEVDTAAVAANYKVLEEAAGCALCPVVKANGYGLGGELMAGAVAAAGAERFAVATVEEGLALRTGGHRGTILVLGGATWLAAPSLLVDADLTPLVSSPEEVRALGAHLRARGRTRPLAVHLAIDTGMGREGIVLDGPPEEALHDLLLALSAEPLISAEGVMSHFANADLADSDFTQTQIERFADVLGFLAETRLPLRYAHLCNSAAILTVGGRPGPLADARFDRFEWWARPGIALGGTTPFPDGLGQQRLRPALRWTASIVLRKRVPVGAPISYGSTWVAERPTEIAVLGLGYADGIPRSISGRGAHVLVGGMRAPLVGRVCMDLICVDVTDVVERRGPEVCEAGRDVVVLGSDGEERIGPWELAQQGGTIAYEILTSLAARVPRVPR